jgi:cytochrome c5
MGLPGDWEQARERGFARVLQNTVDGYANMPPLGTCGSCTEDDFRALIRAMTGIEP